MTQLRQISGSEQLPACRYRDLRREVTVSELMKRFRNAERFVALCRQCPRYGVTWVCPPFDYDTTEWLMRWERATLVASVIEPEGESVPGRMARPLMLARRRHVEKLLHEIAGEQKGKTVALGAFGGCDICGEGRCNRVQGGPCRFPEQAQPSLEALGFDVSAIMSELFNLPLQWPADGSLPARLTIVSAVLSARSKD